MPITTPYAICHAYLLCWEILMAAGQLLGLALQAHAAQRPSSSRSAGGPLAS